MGCQLRGCEGGGGGVRKLCGGGVGVCVVVCGGVCGGVWWSVWWSVVVARKYPVHYTGLLRPLLIMDALKEAYRPYSCLHFDVGRGYLITILGLTTLGQSCYRLL